MRSHKLLLLSVLIVFALSNTVLASETFTIIIENQRDGRILVQRDADVTEVGHVLVPCNAVNHNGFTASAWVDDSTVCATAVNAIHIKVGNSTETGRGIVFSLQPAEFMDFDPADYGSYFSESASVFTDIPAGTGIFGGPFAPLVGSSLSVLEESATDELAQAREVFPEYVPRVGDTLLIAVSRSSAVDYVEFDNSFGGLISLKRIGKEPDVIGQVLKPVAGVGRFGGSIYAGVGRVRANHPGVVCVSTSPISEIGGFQIIPSSHAMSPEMTFARTLTQWMVVGPVDAREPGWEGTAPLFFGHLYPSYLALLNDTPELTGISALNRLLGRFYVMGRMRGNDQWAALPTTTGRVDDALVDLTAIRIYFPMPVEAN
jgi:hypothetical protein